MARQLAAQQEAEERASRQAQLAEEMAGPLQKRMKLQGSTVWGRVAGGAYRSEATTYH